MLERYRAVYRGNTAWLFSTAGFIARMPISMVGIGILMYVQSERDSYTIAGALSASISIAAAVGGPISSRLVDRFGQHRVLPFQIITVLICTIALIILIPTQAPVATLFIFAIFCGLANPSIGALVRARWANLLKSGPILITAFSIESIIDELIFILGPTIAALTSVQIHPAAPQIIAGALLAGGGFWLISMRDSEPEIHHHQKEDRRSILFSNGLIYIWIIHLAAGGFFGAMEMGVISFTERADRPILGGIFLALWALGSLIGGLIYGGTDLKISLPKQLIVISLLLIPAAVALVFIKSLFLLALFSAIAGCGIAPLLIAASAITQERSQIGRTTEGIATMYSGLGLGFAATTAVSGALIDYRGSELAFAIGALMVVAILFLSLASQASLRKQC